MPRFFQFSSLPIRFFRPAPAVCLGISLANLGFCAPQIARADEFSILPPNDPIALQLAVISNRRVPASLTRYEAALQTARAILDAQNRDMATTSRAQWRALAALSATLQNELRLLGVDVEAARALAAKNLKSGESAPAAKAAAAKAAAAKAAAPNSAASKAPALRGPSFLAPALVADAARRPSAGRAAGGLDLQLSPRLRVSSALQSAGATAPAAGDRFAPRGALGESARPDIFASQTALSYDLGRYLTLRAANSRLNWNSTTSGAVENPLLGAPLFTGARNATGTGGGVDFNVGALKFSTEVERLRANTGVSASRIGGGASLSAFQNRLLLDASLSRLSPAAKSELPATATEVGASFGVSPRLSLNLRYQGLFAPTPNLSASRVAGSVNFGF